MHLSDEQLIAEAIEINHAGIGKTAPLECYEDHLVHFSHYLASAHAMPASPPSPVGLCLAMRSVVSLWAGSRLAFHRRPGAAFRCRRYSSQPWSVHPPSFGLSASDDFADRRVVEAGLLADLSQRQTGFLGFFKHLATRGMDLGGLAVKVPLSRLHGLLWLPFSRLRHARTLVGVDPWIVLVPQSQIPWAEAKRCAEQNARVSL
jgi:hypothetical protein